MEKTGLFPASIKAIGGTIWGYINEHGTFIIKPKFKSAFPFQENGLAIVEENLYGIINVKGHFLVKPQYDSITSFSEGRAIGIKDGVFKVINEYGAVLTSKPYSFIGSYKDGRAIFSILQDNQTMLYGYLDRMGKEVIPAKYMQAEDFSDGTATVQEGETKYHLINLEGQILQTFNYPYVGTLKDGLLPFRKERFGKTGFINIHGDMVIQPKYLFAMPFENGKAVVNTASDYGTNQYGLIDTNGNFAIRPEYNDITILGENRVAVGEALDKEFPALGSIYSLATINGALLTDFTFNHISNFKNKYASVYDSEYTFFINLFGNQVKTLPILGGSGNLTIEGPVIQAIVDQRYSYYNHAGDLIWEQNRVIPLTEHVKITEEKYNPNFNYLVYYPQISGIEQPNGEKVNQSLRKYALVEGVQHTPYSSYSGDFTIESLLKDLVVIKLDGYDYPFGAAHGMPNQTYVHINIKNGDIYHLKDLFKPDSNYIEVLSKIIGSKIQANKENYFEDSYEGIKLDQLFYITRDSLHIYFEPYEIAAYAFGFPTFEIPFSEIANIINKQGSFWKSFC